MLERTAGCLEPGSLRRILPGSRKPLKSRRLLHSTFWDHGAIDSKMSPLWMTLIREPELIDEQDEKIPLSTINASSGTFLDFLYPLKALKFIRRYSIQRTRIGIGPLGHRLYTSLANEAMQTLAETHTILEGSTMDDDQKSLTAAEGRLSCEEQPEPGTQRDFDDGNGDDCDKAWRKFELSPFVKKQQMASQLLAYLSISSRPIDAQRSIALFEHIRNAASQQDYQNVMRSYLMLGQIQNAVQLHREVLPVGSETLLAHLVKTSQLHLAYDVWDAVQQYCGPKSTQSYYIWKTLDADSTLRDRGLEINRFIRDEMAWPLNRRINSTMSAFTSGLAYRTLLAMAHAESFEMYTFKALLESLRQIDGDTSERYEELIYNLLRSGHNKAAMQCYRSYRKRTKRKILRPTLDAMLKVASENNSILGMQQIMDDWCRFYKRPSRVAYRMCMSSFAAQGDASMVKKIFEQYVVLMTRKGQLEITRADDIAPLLHVHAKRGEFAEVLHIFDGMKAKYGVEPNIKCWNILLNAYGKVQDVDGAFDRFQTLLDSSTLQPDDYTIGTMMGICITRGDLDSALELYQMAESIGIARSAAMVDCLVLGHIQNDDLLQAEKICDDALGMDLKAPLTRMWNYLLTAYAMRRDIDNTNRILRRMKDAGVDYDGSTYSALMQALAMVKQPDRAREILKRVMPEAGLKATSFHYAVVMGGYIATGELQKVFQLHHEMLKRDIKRTASTRLITLKAQAMEDQKLLESGSSRAQLARVGKLFYDAYNMADARELAETRRKGVGGQPLDIAYSSAYFGYLIFVFSQNNASHQAKELYQRFIGSISEERRGELPLPVLSAFMMVKLREKDYQGVQECWDLAFQYAKKSGQPIDFQNSSKSGRVLPLHRLTLARLLTTQITSLTRQRKLDQLSKTVEEVEAAGFLLDNKNWNLYIQSLAISSKYKEAFVLCENKLMDGWVGWARLRWTEPQRNRLPLELRYQRMRTKPSHLRPLYHTLLSLAKAYLEHQDRAVELAQGNNAVEDIETGCPRTVLAIKTMQRVNDNLQRKFLGR